MKSIKNQYIALKEGKMTEAQFMRNVRMTLPEYISNVTLFKQAERILINKRIISEIKIEEIEKHDPTNNIKNLIKRYEDSNDSMSKILAGLSGAGVNYKVTKAEPNVIKWNYDGYGTNLSGEIKVKNIKKEGKIEETHSSNPNDRYEVKFSKENNTYQVWEGDTLVTDFATKEKADAEAKRLNIKQDAKKLDKNQSNESLKEGVDMGELEDTLKRVKKDNPGKKVGYFFTKDNPKGYKISIDGKHINEAKDTSAIGYYNQDGKEQYSKFDELDNMNAQEIMAGYVLEKIDNPELDKKSICKIVIKNLNKDQFYYTNYKLTGVAGLKPTEFTTTKRKPFFDQMEELDKNGSNLVDEKNKMVVVKEGYQKGDKVTFTSDNMTKPRSGTVVQDLGDDEFTYKDQDGNTYNTRGDRKDMKISKDEMQESEQDLESIKKSIETSLGNSYTANDIDEKIAKYTLNDDQKLEILDYFFTDVPKDPERFDESDYNESDFKSDTGISESQKTKLKEMVKKMMKEMFDGDNLTDVTGENV